MNLRLHGLDAPQVDLGNSLRFKLTNIGERDRVGMILTNPPFGGEEERGIQGNLPEDKQTAETVPIQFEESAECINWWDQPGPRTKRKENERAWRVPAADLLAGGCNLDRKNPRAKEDTVHLPPEQLAESILAKEQRIAEIMGNIQGLLSKSNS